MWDSRGRKKICYKKFHTYCEDSEEITGRRGLSSEYSDEMTQRSELRGVDLEKRTQFKVLLGLRGEVSCERTQRRKLMGH